MVSNAQQNQILSEAEDYMRDNGIFCPNTITIIGLALVLEEKFPEIHHLLIAMTLRHLGPPNCQPPKRIEGGGANWVTCHL